MRGKGPVAIALLFGLLVGLSLKAFLTVAHPPPAAAAPNRPPLTPVPEMEMGFRAREVADRAWPDSVRMDVVLGRVRTGFTVEQMRMARSTGANRLGEPDRRVPTMRPERRGELWIYGEEGFLVVDDTVVAIQDARHLTVR